MDIEQIIKDQTELYTRLQAIRYNQQLAKLWLDEEINQDLRHQSKLIQLELIRLEQLKINALN